MVLFQLFLFIFPKLFSRFLISKSRSYFHLALIIIINSQHAVVESTLIMKKTFAFVRFQILFLKPKTYSLSIHIFFWLLYKILFSFPCFSFLKPASPCIFSVEFGIKFPDVFILVFMLRYCLG